MKISKKIFYLYFVAILIMTGILWGDLLGSESFSSMTIFCGFCLTIIVLETTASAYFKYYSDKIVFAKGLKSKPSRSGFLSKPQNQPVSRYSEVYESHGLFWCFSGYNRGMSYKGSQLFVSPLHRVDYKNLGRTIYFKGEQTKVSKKQLFDIIVANLTKDSKNKIQAIASAKHLFAQMVTADVKDIYIPLPLSAEEIQYTKSLEGECDFGSDRFTAVITWMIERQKLIEYSIKNLDDSIISKLSISSDFMQKIKIAKMHIADAEKEGREIKPQTQQEF